MAYRNTLQADALKLVARRLQSSLAVEGELPEDGLAAYGDDGDDLMLALARKMVAGEEDGRSVESAFEEARQSPDLREATPPPSCPHTSRSKGRRASSPAVATLAPMTTDSRPIAMLIDGDNAQARLLEQVLAEAAKYGTVTTRRIYGDWTTPQMSSWKQSLHSFAVQPEQQFRYTTGKNSTDSALIIDAMDLLHSGTVGGFCIVSSDSDYTRLATRIREQGFFVMGVGQAHTPESFVKACEVFVYTENLAPPDERPVKDAEFSQEDWTVLATRAVEMTTQDDGWAFLGSVGNALRQLDPAFDVRSYGHKQLSPLIRSRADLFEMQDDKTQAGPTVIYVRLRP